jgi:hypothetical protein
MNKIFRKIIIGSSIFGIGYTYFAYKFINKQQNNFSDYCKNENDKEIILDYKLNIDNYDYNKAFKKASLLGHTNMLKWLLSLNIQLDKHIFDISLYNASKNGNLDVIKILINLDDNKINNENNNENNKLSYINDAFLISCQSGNLEIVKYLNSHGIKPNNYDNAFINACQSGNLEIVKYLNSQRIKPINYNDAFMKTSGDKNIEIRKWLLSIDNTIDIHFKDDQCFFNACYNGQLDEAIWLLSLDKFDIRKNDDSIFKNVCRKQKEYQLDIEYLSKSNSGSKIDRHLYLCTIDFFNFDNLKLIKWLTTICDNYEIQIKNGKLENWIIKN